MSRQVVVFWEKISPISYEMRKRLKLPVDIWLEQLYNQMKQTLEEDNIDWS